MIPGMTPTTATTPTPTAGASTADPAVLSALELLIGPFPSRFAAPYRADQATLDRALARHFEPREPR